MCERIFEFLPGDVAPFKYPIKSLYQENKSLQTEGLFCLIHRSEHSPTCAIREGMFSHPFLNKKNLEIATWQEDLILI